MFHSDQGKGEGKTIRERVKQKRQSQGKRKFRGALMVTQKRIVKKSSQIFYCYFIGSDIKMNFPTLK